MASPKSDYSSHSVYSFKTDHAHRSTQLVPHLVLRISLGVSFIMLRARTSRRRARAAGREIHEFGLYGTRRLKSFRSCEIT